jgi:Fic family protein
MKYIWQQPNWPHFEYDLSHSQDVLYRYAKEASYLSGSLDQLPSNLQWDALIDLMVSEGIKTSEIEGEKLDQEDVRSSLRNQLGLTEKPETIKDPRAQGIAHLMIAVRKKYGEPLTKEEIFAWHTMILGEPSSKLEVGMWRTSNEPMQIVSGPIGREIIHYEAPPSIQVDREMTQFIVWFNKSVNIPGPVRAALAHLYFECIHPFADGNGRVGRALVEKVLSQELQRPVLLSLSTTLEKNRKTYYEELSIASKNGLTVTRWINYFVETIYQSLLDSKKQIVFIVQKAHFWKRWESKLNERQSKVLAKMFDAGIEGYKGGMSAQKYMKITTCSKATATRDLKELLEYGCIEPLPGSGRSTRYVLTFAAK